MILQEGQFCKSQEASKKRRRVNAVNEEAIE